MEIFSRYLKGSRARASTNQNRCQTWLQSRVPKTLILFLLKGPGGGAGDARERKRPLRGKQILGEVAIYQL